MVELTLPRWARTVIPICAICFLYICSFHLFICATNSLIYSTICLLRANVSFCDEIDRNRSLRLLQEEIQSETSQWSLYGTLSFAIIACLIAPIYGSLSDTNNRKLPIVLTICNSIIAGLLVTIASVFQGTKTCLILYLIANIVNGFGGGILVLISSCFGYATDTCAVKAQQVQTIAVIEVSLNVGITLGYVFCTFLFEVHGRTWVILVVHVLLLALALLIALVFLKDRSPSISESISIRQKIVRPIFDTRDLIVELKRNRFLVSFLILLLSLLFYELFRMGSASIYYLYLHYLSFDDAQYAAFFTIERMATCVALLLLALLRGRWKINDLYLCMIGLCLSLIGLILFAFHKNHAMIFGAIPSMMFEIYFPVCLRAVIASLVPERDKGKAFSFVALVQNIDIVVGTVVCTQIYRATLDSFPGAVFMFAAGTRVVALLFLLIQICCISETPELQSEILFNNPILEIQLEDDEEFLDNGAVRS